MPQKYNTLFVAVQSEYTQLKENCITWVGLVFLDYIERIYKIELKGDEALVLTDTGMSQQTTGIGYGINLPALPACMVLHYYDQTLAERLMRGEADENTIIETIREFFKDYINYAKVFISRPSTFIKVKHKDLICDKPGKGSIATLKSFKHGKV